MASPLPGDPVLGTDVQARAAAIRLVVFDVDGVLTDGRIVLGDDGYEGKIFHTHDGLGIRMLGEADIERAVLTARSSALVSRRMAELGVDHVIQGRRDKGTALVELLDRLDCPATATAYVGDDDVDVPALRRVGLAIAVANASTLARTQAHWITQREGGSGAAREVAEGILQAQDKLAAIRAQWLI